MMLANLLLLLLAATAAVGVAGALHGSPSRLLLMLATATPS
jgi:hypothetical protein